MKAPLSEENKSRIMIASSNANKRKHFIYHVYLKEIVLAKYWYDYEGY